MLCRFVVPILFGFWVGLQGTSRKAVGQTGRGQKQETEVEGFTKGGEREGQKESEQATLG